MGPCREIGGGEARTTDIGVHSAVADVVVRHPADALGLPGLGGGTVIDAALVGHADGLRELVPLVAGAWATIDRWALNADGIDLWGSARALPGEPEVDATAVDVAWRLDGARLEAGGATGLWLHPIGPAEVYPHAVVVGDTAYRHDGTVLDLGGAIVIEGASALRIADATGVWAPDEGGLAAYGIAPGATAVELLDDGVVVGRSPVRDGAFDLIVDGEITAVRATAPGHAPGPSQAPGADLALDLGAGGRLVVALSGPDRAVLRWRSDAGPAGRAVVADGGQVDTGAGRVHAELDAGPQWSALDLELDVVDDTPVVFAPEPVDFAPGWRAVALVVSDRSPLHRGDDDDALAVVAARGADLALLVGDDDVPDLPDASVPVRATVRSHAPAGWSTLSWPWQATSRHGGHGAPDVRALAPAEAIPWLWGGPSTRRRVAVDLAWLAAVDPAANDAPDLVALNRPSSVDDLLPWFAWLDAGRDVRAVAAWTWVAVPDDPRVGGADIERALLDGLGSAGSGPLVVASLASAVADGADGPTPMAAVEVDVLGGDVDRLVLVTEGGHIVHDGPATRAVVRIAPQPRWVVPVALGARDWAVGQPLWLAGLR